MFTFIYPINLTYTGYNTTDTSLLMVFAIIFDGDTLHHYIAFRQTTIISMHYTHLKLKEFFISINKTMNSIILVPDTGSYLFTSTFWYKICEYRLSVSGWVALERNGVWNYNLPFEHCPVSGPKINFQDYYVKMFIECGNFNLNLNLQARHPQQALKPVFEK